MPFGMFDKDKKLLERYRKHSISAIVMLLSDEECLMREKINLREIYNENGFEVIYYPINDFSIPSRSGIEDIINLILEKAEKSENIVIHCYAGRGRTGTILAILAKKIFNLPGRRAISWVREYVPKAVESQEQIEFIISF